MSCIDLAYTVLKILEQYSSDNNKLEITEKTRRKKKKEFSYQ